MTKANFKKVAASRIVSSEFSVISEDSYTSEWLLTTFFLVCWRSCDLLILSTLQHQRYLELSFFPYLLPRKLGCLALFLENFQILENVWQNRCSRVFSRDRKKMFFWVIENDQVCSKWHLDELCDKQE